MGLDAWWTNRERLYLVHVLHKLGRDSEAINYLDELEQHLLSIAIPDNQAPQLLAEAIELRSALGV